MTGVARRLNPGASRPVARENGARCIMYGINHYCALMSGGPHHRDYTAAECTDIVGWLQERAAGYPPILQLLEPETTRAIRKAARS